MTSVAVPVGRVARQWLPVAGPGLAMLVIALVRPTRPVLSWDEIATADVARRSVTQIWQLLHNIDGVFGPYYLFMHWWTALFGDSVLSLRLPSILAMAGAVALAAALGRSLFGPVAGLLTGGLLCLIPNISRYAAEARPYAIACLLSTLALILLHRALEQPNRRRWVAYGVSTTVLGLFSLVGLVALAGHAAVIVLRRGRWRPWLLAVLATVVVVAPLIWWGSQQRQAQLHWMPPMTVGSVYQFPALLTGSAPVGWLLLGLLVLAAIQPARVTIELAAVVLTPLVLVGAAAFAGTSFWVNRYLLFVLFPAAIVAAAGLARSRLAAILALSLFAAAAVPGQMAVRQPTVKNGSDYRRLAKIIDGRDLPGDTIVYDQGRTMRAGVGYYLRHRGIVLDDVLVRQTAAQAAGLKATEVPDPAARLAGADRIWLVVSGRGANPDTIRPELEPLLRSEFRQDGLWRVKRGTMALYVRIR